MLYSAGQCDGQCGAVCWAVQGRVQGCAVITECQGRLVQSQLPVALKCCTVALKCCTIAVWLYCIKVLYLVS